MDNSALMRERVILTLNEEIKNSIRKIFPEEEHRRVTFSRKQILFEEKSPYRGVYIISSGLVKLSSKASGNKDFIFSIIGKGDYLGFLCPLTGNSEYMLSASALTDVEATFIPDHVFKQVLTMNSRLEKLFLELMGMDSQNVNQKTLDLAYKPVRGRLADALLLLEERTNIREKSRQIKITRHELASYIGTVRETATRLLAEFKQEKIIHIRGDLIKIKDHEKLAFISALYK